MKNNKDKIIGTIRYETDKDFFDLDGSVHMYLTTAGALAVCYNSAQRGFMIYRIEGGIWHYPGFEPRTDCIWDGGEPPISIKEADEDNNYGAEFILSKSEVHNVWIITVVKANGEDINF